MPRIPIYESQLRQTSRPAGEEIPVFTAGIQFRGLRQSGNVLGEIAQQFRKAQAIDEFSKASIFARNNLNNLLLNLQNEQDYKVIEKKYQKEAEKIKNNALKMISLESVKNEFLNRFNDWSLQNFIKARNIARKKQIETGLSNFYQGIDLLKKEYFNAFSPEEEGKILNELKSFIDLYTKSGYLSQDKATNLYFSLKEDFPREKRRQQELSQRENYKKLFTDFLYGNLNEAKVFNALKKREITPQNASTLLNKLENLRMDINKETNPRIFIEYYKQALKDDLNLDEFSEEISQEFDNGRLRGEDLAELMNLATFLQGSKKDLTREQINRLDNLIIDDDEKIKIFRKFIDRILKKGLEGDRIKEEADKIIDSYIGDLKNEPQKVNKLLFETIQTPYGEQIAFKPFVKLGEKIKRGLDIYLRDGEKAMKLIALRPDVAFGLHQPTPEEAIEIIKETEKSWDEIWKESPLGKAITPSKEAIIKHPVLAFPWWFVTEFIPSELINMGTKPSSWVIWKGLDIIMPAVGRAILTKIAQKNPKLFEFLTKEIKIPSKIRNRIKGEIAGLRHRILRALGKEQPGALKIPTDEELMQMVNQGDVSLAQAIRQSPQLFKQRLEVEVKAGKEIAKPTPSKSPQAPPETIESEIPISTFITELLNRGFTEQQLNRATPETIKALVEKNLKPEEVSILPSGELKIIGKKPETKPIPKELEPYQMTQKEYIDLRKPIGRLEVESVIGRHRMEVKDALKKGIRVPARVLKDYPGIKEEVKKEAKSAITPAEFLSGEWKLARGYPKKGDYVKTEWGGKIYEGTITGDKPVRFKTGFVAREITTPEGIKKWMPWTSSAKYYVKRIPEKIKKEIEFYTGLPLPTETLEKIEKLGNILDVEAPFKKIGAPKTGLAIKTYFSKRELHREKALDLIKKLSRADLDKEDYTTLAFLAERPALFVKLSEEEKKKFSPYYHLVRDFFDKYQKILKEKGLEVDFFGNLKRRLQERNTQLKAALEKIEKGDEFMKRMHGDKVQKWLEELKDNERILNRIKQGKFQFVHIPARVWFEIISNNNPQRAYRILSFLVTRKRETISLEDLIKNGLIEKDEVDIRDILASYTDRVGRDIALLDILNSAKKENLVKNMADAPVEWVELPTRIFPMFKGYKVHPIFADFLESYMEALKDSSKIGRFLAFVKMAQFYNPVFLPMYDAIQAAMLGSVVNIKAPKYLKKAIKQAVKKPLEYWEAFENGLFSQPFINPFEDYIKMVNRMKKEKRITGALLNLLPQNLIKRIYTISWHTAWNLDRVLRLISYNYLIEKGLPSQEAAQLAALFHGDYASVPPRTRRVLNKIFFTPTFKVAMGKLYWRMLEGGTKFYKGGEESILARGLLYVLGIIFGKHFVVSAWGFKADEFCRRYVKEVKTEEGKKELVLTFSNPANLLLKYYWRIKEAFNPAVTNKIQKMLQAVEWELHPIYRIAVQIVQNRRPNGEYVYNPFASRTKQLNEILLFATSEILRITSGLIESRRGEENIKTFKALQQSIGKLEAIVLKPFIFSYMRQTKEKRLKYQIRMLKIEFNRFKRRNVDNPEEVRKALRDFQERLREIKEQFKK